MVKNEPPEALSVEDGKWIRRDVFIDSFDADEERAEEALDELIEDDVMESMNLYSHEYVRGTSDRKLMGEWAKQKSKLAGERIRDLARDVLGGGADGDA